MQPITDVRSKLYLRKNLVTDMSVYEMRPRCLGWLYRMNDVRCESNAMCIPILVYIEPCFCYGVCTVVFVSLYNHKIKQSPGHDEILITVHAMSRTWKIYTSQTPQPRFQLQYDNVYFTKLWQCKLCWAAKSEPWPCTWFPWKLFVESIFVGVLLAWATCVTPWSIKKPFSPHWF